MTYTKEQFLSDVKAEAVALRQHATKEELGRLDADWMDPNDFTSCIYGQMTGNCNSKRAIELMQKCCTRFFKNLYKEFYVFDDVSSAVNGEKCDLSGRKNDEMPKYFSAVETYIFTDEEKNENLISYLRGETDDLNL